MQPATRHETVEDLPSLANLYRQPNPDDVAAPPNQVAAVSEEILPSEHFELIVADTGCKQFGTFYCNVIPNLTWGAWPCAVVENVVVPSDLRRQGGGRRAN
jgi:hypothetical protein